MTEWVELDAERRRDLSHWRGHGRWKGVEGDRAWLDIGRRHVEMLADMARHAYAEWPPRVVVDYGCGGGSNGVALAEAGAQCIVGVDLYSDTLEAARLEVELAGAYFVPQFPHELAEGRADAVVCTAVIQHAPSLDTAEAALCMMARAAKPGALALIQTRYDDMGAPPGDVCTRLILSSDDAVSLLAGCGFSHRHEWIDPSRGYAFHGCVRL